MTLPEALAAIEALPPAAWLRASWPAYAVVNAVHILGVALLLGAILPLDLRLTGLLPGPPLAVLGRFLSRLAAAGLALAVVSGALLFATAPGEYMANPAFLAKLALIGLALANLAAIHAGGGWRAALAGAPVGAALRAGAIASALLWLGALLAGRIIGFI